MWFARYMLALFFESSANLSNLLLGGVEVKYYRWDILVTIAVGVALTFFFGPSALVTFVILVGVEVSFSGDNANVNVKLLRLLSDKWVFAFMTIGMLIAAGGMRFIFPILVVSLTGRMSFGGALHLAFTNHAGYAAAVNAAHPQIRVFSGVYLLMIAATFFLVENQEGHWLAWIERPLAKVGKKVDNLAPILTIITVLALSATIGPQYQLSILLAGFISLVSYMVIKAVTDIAGGKEQKLDEAGRLKKYTGWSALGIFIALECQDAAFSFDGVSGALAITTNPILIFAGLGVGALIVRSAIRHLMETNKPGEFHYLEQGAYYGILFLAGTQLILAIDIPGYLLGCVSMGLIMTAVVHSHVLNKRDRRQGSAGASVPEVEAK
jgi:hypothetical protein